MPLLLASVSIAETSQTLTTCLISFTNSDSKISSIGAALNDYHIIQNQLLHCIGYGIIVSSRPTLDCYSYMVIIYINSCVIDAGLLHRYASIAFDILSSNVAICFC